MRRAQQSGAHVNTNKSKMWVMSVNTSPLLRNNAAYIIFRTSFCPVTPPPRRKKERGRSRLYSRQGTCYPFHNYPLGSILTGPYYPFHSESGSILSSARMRDGVELCHSPPRRFSQPVVHNQESPLVSCVSCECASCLYSTQAFSDSTHVP